MRSVWGISSDQDKCVICGKRDSYFWLFDQDGIKIEVSVCDEHRNLLKALDTPFSHLMRHIKSLIIKQQPKKGER